MAAQLLLVLATWSQLSQCRAYNLGDCGGLAEMCGERRMVGLVLQTCLISTQNLTPVRWVALLSLPGVHEAASPNQPGVSDGQAGPPTYSFSRGLGGQHRAARR